MLSHQDLLISCELEKYFWCFCQYKSSPIVVQEPAISMQVKVSKWKSEIKKIFHPLEVLCRTYGDYTLLLMYSNFKFTDIIWI